MQPDMSTIKIAAPQPTGSMGQRLVEIVVSLSLMCPVSGIQDLVCLCMHPQRWDSTCTVY
jgi:hypothetical protein